MSIDEATVRRVAKLARLKVPESEIPPLAGELSQIFAWIEQLNEVDVTGVQPMTSVVKATLKARPDVVKDGDYADKVLANAPAATSGFFAVPKIVE